MTSKEATNELRKIRTTAQFRELASKMRASGLDFYSKKTGAYAFHFTFTGSNRVGYLYDQKRTTSALQGNSLIGNLYKVMNIR